MNERIKELAFKTGFISKRSNGDEWRWGYIDPELAEKLEQFAELIVRECKEDFTKVWYEQGLDIRGAEIGKFLTRFDEHFEVE